MYFSGFWSLKPVLRPCLGFTHSERLKNLLLGRTAVVFLDPSPTYDEYWYKALYEGDHYYRMRSWAVIPDLQRVLGAPVPDLQRVAYQGFDFATNVLRPKMVLKSRARSYISGN